VIARRRGREACLPTIADARRFPVAIGGSLSRAFLVRGGALHLLARFAAGRHLRRAT